MTHNQKIARTINKTAENVKILIGTEEGKIALESFLIEKHGKGAIGLLEEKGMMDAYLSDESRIIKIFEYLIEFEPQALATNDLLKKDETAFKTVMDEILMAVKSEKVRKPAPQESPAPQKSPASQESPAKWVNAVASAKSVPNEEKIEHEHESGGSESFRAPTVDQFINYYGGEFRKGKKSGDDDVSCVGFLNQIYGYCRLKCRDDCRYSHCLNNFGTPFGMLYVNSAEFHYYYRFVNKIPIIFQISRQEVKDFSDGCDYIPLGTKIDCDKVPRDLFEAVKHDQRCRLNGCIGVAR